MRTHVGQRRGPPPAWGGGGHTTTTPVHTHARPHSFLPPSVVCYFDGRLCWGGCMGQIGSKGRLLVLAVSKRTRRESFFLALLLRAGGAASVRATEQLRRPNSNAAALNNSSFPFNPPPGFNAGARPAAGHDRRRTDRGGQPRGSHDGRSCGGEGGRAAGHLSSASLTRRQHAYVSFRTTR